MLQTFLSHPSDELKIFLQIIFIEQSVRRVLIFNLDGYSVICCRENEINFTDDTFSLASFFCLGSNRGRNDGIMTLGTDETFVTV